MNNKQYPGQPMEESPDMSELDMEIDIAPSEAPTLPEDGTDLDALAEELEEASAAEPESPAEEAVPDDTILFTPEEDPNPVFHTPQLGEEITADELAMASHELSHHSEMDLELDDEEPFYDDSFHAADEEGLFAGLSQSAAAQSVTIGDSKPRAPRKGRPKRKKGYGLFGIPHLLATVVWLAIIVAIGVSLGRMLWLCAADVLAFGREDKAVSVTIHANDTIEDIAQTLHEAELIRYPGLFKLYASLAVDEGEIATGTFTLNTIYDYHAIVNGMSAYSSFRSVVEDVLIPEGYNCRQIFELLEENGICTVAELEEYAANGEFTDFWFLEGIERGDKYCLEGYLFPDTYDFYAGSTPREALGKMLLGFEARFTEEMRSQLPALNERLSAMMRANGCSESFIAENQIGMKELVIVASLIEEETSSASESQKIASVIYNRLTQDQAYERYLGIDATILYALGEHKETLTAEDLAIESPYNTRTNAGLVPTPITNPGLSSLEAALDPADTDFYYYVLNPSTGSHQFSKTYEEHQAWIEEFGG